MRYTVEVKSEWNSTEQKEIPKPGARQLHQMRNTEKVKE